MKMYPAEHSWSVYDLCIIYMLCFNKKFKSQQDNKKKNKEKNKITLPSPHWTYLGILN